MSETLCANNCGRPTMTGSKLCGRCRFEEGLRWCECCKAPKARKGFMLCEWCGTYVCEDCHLERSDRIDPENDWAACRACAKDKRLVTEDA